MKHVIQQTFLNGKRNKRNNFGINSKHLEINGILLPQYYETHNPNIQTIGRLDELDQVICEISRAIPSRRVEFDRYCQHMACELDKTDDKAKEIYTLKISNNNEKVIRPVVDALLEKLIIKEIVGFKLTDCSLDEQRHYKSLFDMYNKELENNLRRVSLFEQRERDTERFEEIATSAGYIQ